MKSTTVSLPSAAVNTSSAVRLGSNWSLHRAWKYSVEASTARVSALVVSTLPSEPMSPFDCSDTHSAMALSASSVPIGTRKEPA